MNKEKATKNTNWKPCPFCGSRHVNIYTDYFNGTDLFGVQCAACGAKTDTYESKEEAGKAWNERARAYDGLPIPPGYTIRECMEHDGMTMEEFAQKVGLPAEKAEEMLKGGLPVDETLAERLEELFGPGYNFWRNLEKRFRRTLWEYWQATEEEEWKS